MRAAIYAAICRLNRRPDHALREFACFGPQQLVSVSAMSEVSLELLVAVGVQQACQPHPRWDRHRRSGESRPISTRARHPNRAAGEGRTAFLADVS